MKKHVAIVVTILVFVSFVVPFVSRAEERAQRQDSSLIAYCKELKSAVHFADTNITRYMKKYNETSEKESDSALYYLNSISMSVRIAISIRESWNGNQCNKILEAR